MLSETKEIYEFGPFRLDVGEHTFVRCDGITNGALPEKAFQTLVFLVRNQGRLVTKNELLDAIWPDTVVEENNLNKSIHSIRHALGEKTREQKYIETVPKHGYRFIAEARRVDSDPTAAENGSSANIDDNTERHAPRLPDSSGDKMPSQSDEKPQTSSPLPVATSRPNLIFHRWPVVLVGLLLLSGLLLGLNAGGLRDRLLGNADPARIQSLAVLPLENLSGDTSQDYFVDGMTDALIIDLTKVRALRVISLPSVMQYKNTRKPLPEIGRDLNVDAVLSGSVLRSGERVRITVQLTHATTGQNLWADSYERDLRDLLVLQREVTQDIVREIRVTIAPQEQVQFGNIRPVDPEAYDHYLRGKFYLHSQDKGNNEAAITALERAIAIDPTFAAAHAELAQAYVWKLFLFAPKEEQLAEKAFIAAEKALALDPDLAVAHLARGRLLWTPANRFPHEKAIREYRRALELNPNLDEARNQLALVYCHIGALNEALLESHKAITTNPNNNLAQFRIGQTLNFQGKYEEALTVLNAIPPKVNRALVGHQIAWALFNLGRKEESSAMLERLLSDNPEDSGGLFTSVQAVLAAAAGQERIAEDKIKMAVEKGKGFGHFHHTAYHIACAYSLLGKPEHAVNWLRMAADDGFPCYPLFEHDTNLNPIRQSPQFVRFIQDVKMQSEKYQRELAD